MKETTQSSSVRPACLLVEAAKGHKLAAYGLIRRAVKKAGLTVSAFVSESEARSYDLRTARFIVDCTDAQLEQLLNVGRSLALAEGWERFPVDTYHD